MKLIKDILNDPLMAIGMGIMGGLIIVFLIYMWDILTEKD